HTLPSTPRSSSSFSLNDTSPSAIYTLSLHDALPIFSLQVPKEGCAECARADRFACLQRPNSFQHVPCRSVSLQVPAHSRPHALQKLGLLSRCANQKNLHFGSRRPRHANRGQVFIFISARGQNQDVRVFLQEVFRPE